MHGFNAHVFEISQWFKLVQFIPMVNFTLLEDIPTRRIITLFVGMSSKQVSWTIGKFNKNMDTLLCSHNMSWALKSCLSSIARWKRQKTYMGMAAMLEHQKTSMFIFLIFQCASVDKRSNHWNTQKYEHGSHVRTSMVSMFIFFEVSNGSH